MAGKRVFVGNLSPDVSDDALRDFFEKACGPVALALVIYKDGVHQSYGFVEFLSYGAVPEALLLTGKQLCGRALRVSKAKERGNA